MGIESAPDPADHLRLGVPFVDPPTHLVRAVPHRARLGHRHMAPACVGLAAEKQMTSPLAPVFIVGPRRTAGLSRHGRAFFANQLLTRLINGARGPLRIVRFLLQLHDVLPPSHELRAYGRQAPLLRVPRLETVFCNVWRIVSRTRDSAKPRSTTLSASNWSAPRARPSGS